MAGLLTALLYGAGGYGQGRQQATVNKQNQQSLDQEQAYRQAEEKRQDAQLTLEQQAEKDKHDAYTRDTGTDPKTGKPFVMPASLYHMAPGKVGQTYNPSPAQKLQDQYNHQMLWYQTLQQQGQVTAAAGWLASAQETGRQMNLMQTEGAEADRQERLFKNERILADKRSSDEDRRQAQRDIDALNREEEIRGTPTWADTHGTWSDRHGGGAKGANKASTDEATWYTKWSKLTTAQNSQVPGVKNPPVIPPAQAAAASKKFSVIDRAGDPRAVAQALANKEPNAAIKALILERGNVAAEKKAGASSGNNGGSDDDLNPPPSFQNP